MLHIKFNRRTIRGSLARQLLMLARIGSKDLEQTSHYGRLYTTRLSDNFRFPKGIRAEWHTHKTAKMELIYRADDKPRYLIIQFHGGAYQYGYSDSYRRSALKYLSITCETKVLSLDYRLAPEHSHPSALEDAIMCYDYALQMGYDPEKIIVVGDSAGGGLALALGLYLRDHHLPLPKAMITMSAWTDLAADGESYIRNKSRDPLLGERIETLDVAGIIGETDVYDPYISPAYGSYEGFCDLMMHVGDCEVLESDTLTVARKAAQAGNRVDVTIYRGMFHVFQLAFSLIPDAQKAWKEIGRYIAGQFTECSVKER
jgi:acetyl esterase/lipase